MVTLLRKIFIKNYDDVTNEEVRVKHGFLSSIIGIIVNLILVVFKLLIGIVTFSISIISDAVNNLGDFITSVTNMVGFKLSNLPPDKRHPFGHQRIEYISALIISFFIVSVSLILGYESIVKLVEGNKETFINIYVFIILGVSIFLKLILGYVNYGLGKAINSPSIKGVMVDSLNDAATTTLILISSIIQFYVPEAWYLDGAVGVLMSVLILISGIKMVIETSSDLIGKAPDSSYIENIVNDIESYDGVLGTHDLMIHTYGPTKKFMSIHVEVDGYQDVFKSHDLIDNIEKEIGEKYKILLTIHMDPIDTHNKEIPIIKEHIAKILSVHSSKLSFHDVRVVTGKTHSNVIFDLVIPNDVKLDKNLIKNEIGIMLKSLNSDYEVVINFDDQYFVNE